MAEKENFTFRFSIDDKSKLEKLFNSKIYKTTTSKLESSINLLNNLYECATLDVKNIFSISEAKFIISIFEGINVNYTENSSVKDYLEKIYKMGRYNFNEISNINFNNLDEKIGRLTDLQAFVILNKIVDYLNIESDKEKSIFDLGIVDANNIYSIDVVFDSSLSKYKEEIKSIVLEILINEFSDEYIIDDDISLENVNIPGHDYISIVFRAVNRMAISDRYEFKELLKNNIMDQYEINDININFVSL